MKTMLYVYGGVPSVPFGDGEVATKRLFAPNLPQVRAEMEMQLQLLKENSSGLEFLRVYEAREIDVVLEAGDILMGARSAYADLIEVSRINATPFGFHVQIYHFPMTEKGLRLVQSEGHLFPGESWTEGLRKKVGRALDDVFKEALDEEQESVSQEAPELRN